MITIFNSEEVYIGYSLADFSKAKQALAQEPILYRYRVEDSTTAARRHPGNFGKIPMYETCYALTVKRTDAERARYLIDKALHE